MNKNILPLVVLASLAGCSSTSDEPTQAAAPVNTQVNETPLKFYADQLNLAVGIALETGHLKDPQFKETLIREFNQITPENEMKFQYVQPHRDHFDFTKSDELVEFAEEHDMTVKGHALVWHIQNPKWLEDGDWTADELKAILEKHIKTVVGHYKGRIDYWDVVNEAFDDNGGYRETIWYNVIGEEYIELAFKWAHEADPDAVLFYNDYSTEGMNAKSNAVYRKMQELIEKGVPVHGVGTQLHLTYDSPISDSAIARNIERLKDLGLDVHFTEIDVRVRDGGSDMALQEQAKRYEMLMKLAVYYPEVDMYTSWGLTDNYSWVPHWFKGYGRALMFDEDYQPKPAYTAVQNVLLDAVTGNFAYAPVTDASMIQRYVQPFNAKPLSSGKFNASEVVFYPFAYNQLAPRDQRLPARDKIDGKWAVGYHNNALIGQVIREDSKTVTDKQQSWENDNVEVFIRIGDAFWQLRAKPGSDFEPSAFTGKASGKWSSDGKVFDFRIEFPDYKDLVGETFGFNIALSDNDGDTEGGNRHAQLYPLTGTNVGWQGEEFGELFMNGQNAVVPVTPVSTPPAFKAIKLSGAPDSADFGEWKNAYSYSFAFNQLNQSDMTVSSSDDISGDWKMGYHENWLYGVVNRYDDKTVTNMEQSYQNDNIEVFVQDGGKDMAQFRSVVGADFEKNGYTGKYFAKWNKEGTQMFFGVELSDKIKSGGSVAWNIALSDNDDGKGRKYQLYPVPGSNMSYMGEELTKLSFE